MTDAELRAALVAAWDQLGRPWVPDIKGVEIRDLPRWLEERPRHEWGGVHFYLAVIFAVLMLIHIILHWTWIKCRGITLPSPPGHRH